MIFFFFDQICTNTIFSVFSHSKYSFFFQALNSEGILMFSQQSPSLGQDFVSIILKEGFVIFSYDLGTGPTHIKYPKKIKIGHWHKVQAKRWHR